MPSRLNGPKMTSHDFTEWAASMGVALNHIERFNRTYRHGVLDAYVFKIIVQAQNITEEWLLLRNEQRPHDALGGRPPRQFLPRLTTAAISSNELST